MVRIDSPTGIVVDDGVNIILSEFETKDNLDGHEKFAGVI